MNTLMIVLVVIAAAVALLVWMSTGRHKCQPGIDSLSEDCDEPPEIEKPEPIIVDLTVGNWEILKLGPASKIDNDDILRDMSASSVSPIYFGYISKAQLTVGFLQSLDIESELAYLAKEKGIRSRAVVFNSDNNTDIVYKQGVWRVINNREKEWDRIGYYRSDSDYSHITLPSLHSLHLIFTEQKEFLDEVRHEMMITAYIYHRVNSLNHTLVNAVYSFMVYELELMTNEYEQNLNKADTTTIISIAAEIVDQSDNSYSSIVRSVLEQRMDRMKQLSQARALRLGEIEMLKELTVDAKALQLKLSET